MRFADSEDPGFLAGNRDRRRMTRSRTPVSAFPRGGGSTDSNIRRLAFERRAQFPTACRWIPRYELPRGGYLELGELHPRDARGSRVTFFPDVAGRGRRNRLFVSEKPSLFDPAEHPITAPRDAEGDGGNGGGGEGNQSCAHKRRGCGTYNDVYTSTTNLYNRSSLLLSIHLCVQRTVTHT